MPRSPDYPVDLFTSCLTTPARVALLWHSRHYFCFNCGLLQPLNTFFVEESEDKQRTEEILLQIKITLRATVESIALELLDPKLFSLFFRTDETIAELFIGFILSTRVLSNFHVHPISYPKLPSFVEHNNWHVFDLRLDSSLFLLSNKFNSNNEVSFHNFLSQTLYSMRNFVEAENEVQQVPFELCFYPEILSDKELLEEACVILAKYLDRSSIGINYCISLNILKPLFKLLNSKILNPSILFCCIKIFSYSKDTRNILFKNNNSRIIEEVIIPALKTSNAKFALIFFTILLNESASLSRRIVFNYDVFKSFNLDPSQGESLIWKLQLIGCSLQSILNPTICQKILTQIIELSKVAKPEIQISIINALSGFIQDSCMIRTNDIMQKKKIEKNAVKAALRFSNSISSITRRELYLLIHKFEVNHKQQIIEKQSNFYKDIRSFLSKCKEDPSEIVQNAYEEGEKNNGIIPSFILDSYISLFLNPVYDIVMKTDITNPFFTLFQTKEIIKPKRKNFIPQQRNNKIEQKTLKLNTIYNHNTVITSNLIYFPDDKLIFGDSNGRINIKLWDNVTILNQSQISKRPITDVKYINNNDHPLIFSANQDGDCLCCSIDNDFNFNIKAAFHIMDVENTSRNVQHEISDQNFYMYSYVYGESDEFIIHDLKNDKILSPIHPKNGKTMSLQTLKNFPNCIALCGNSFEYYDLRVSINEPVVSNVLMNSNAYSLRVIDEVSPTFAIASETSNVYTLELKHPEAIRTTTPYFGMDQTEQQTYAFTAHKYAQCAAIAHPYGVTCLHLFTGRQEQLPNFSRNRPLLANAMLFHEKKFALAIVQEHESILNAV